MLSQKLCQVKVNNLILKTLNKYYRAEPAPAKFNFEFKYSQTRTGLNEGQKNYINNHSAI